ncbi:MULTISPECIES: 4-amino-4-deoxy-L-arabinose transferase [Prochlorococcus]|uniref:4-amino-4-deoxy-L-arabinose transferase n=1 Tax=Prochlorococcus TaxID=1218 RepID=UPI000533B5F4|nr:MULTISPECIES: 4-amino-4-deoxy-L-arabinose transferase [Prochlorococcus]KGG11902.1 hypothetical protein EV05_1103 [Prochlorococcus sp. MIT 0601]
MIHKSLSFKKSPLIGLIILWIFSFILFYHGLGDVALRDFDEATVARVAYEISQKDGLDQLLPSLWGNNYLNKPPGLHWLIAWMIKINAFSETNILPSELIIRIVPAFISSIVIPIGGLIQWKLRPNEKSSALITSSILLTLLPIIRHGRLAMLDGTQLTAISVFWLLLISIDNSKKDLFKILSAGLISSFMLLLKAPLLIPTAIAALIAMFRDNKRVKFIWIKWYLIGLIPGIAWHIWNGINTGEGALILWFHNGAKRVLFEEGIGSDLGFLVPLIEIAEGGWPWILLLPFGLVMAWKERDTKWGKWVLSLSFIMGISIFSLRTQLPWYVHPMWLPFALICAPALTRLTENKFKGFGLDKWLKFVPNAWILIGSILFCLGLLSSFGYIKGYDDYRIISLFVGSGWISGGFFIKKETFKLRILGISCLIIGNFISLFILMGSPNWIWELNENWSVKPIAEMVIKNDPTNIIIKGSFERPSLNWYSNRKIRSYVSSEGNNWYLVKTMANTYEIKDKSCSKKDSKDEWAIFYCTKDDSFTKESK